MGLVGRVVEGVDADVLRDAPGDGQVLLRRDVPVQRDDQPVAWGLRAVAVGGVEAPGVPVQQLAGGLQGVLPGVVYVEGHEAPGRHGVSLAGALDVAAHEAADVLGPGLQVFAHGLVLLGCLAGLLAVAELPREVLPRDAPGRPVLAEAVRCR